MWGLLASLSKHILSARLKVNFRPDPDLAESLDQDLSFEYVGQ